MDDGVDDRDLRNLNDTECRDCGADMTFARGFGWVCQTCLEGRQ